MAEIKIEPYLEYSEFIITEQAMILANQSSIELEIVKNCFKYVRDAIKHI